MESIGKQLQYYRKKCRLTQSDLAIIMTKEGYPTTLKSISTWERDTAVPNAKQFLVLCRILNIYDIYSVFIEKEIPQPVYRIPLRLQAVSAGTGEYIDDAGYEYVEITDPRADYALRISGDSMEPLYYDKDIVFIHSSNTMEIGDIGIFYIDGNQYVKKLGNNQLISLNPKYDPIPLDNVTTFRILGEVIQ